jgi:hypothetical protein
VAAEGEAAVTDTEIIRTLDIIEANLRMLEHRCYRIREVLRKRIDPMKKRQDLGYWPEDDNGTLRPKVEL